MLPRRLTIDAGQSLGLLACYCSISIALPTGLQVSGSGRQRAARARPGLPRLPLRQPNCHCPVSIRGRSCSSSQWNVLSIRSVICRDLRGSPRLSRPAARLQLSSLPLIPLLVIGVGDIFTGITNDPLYLYQLLRKSTMQKS